LGASYFCADFSKFPLRRAFSDEFLVLPLSRAVLGSHIWVKPAEAPVSRFGLTNINAGRENPLKMPILCFRGRTAG
jgi:hypothetical protein